MSRRNQNLFDGIGSWKRRPIRSSKKTYMPAHKRWGKVTVTQMPRADEEVNEMTINDLIKSAVESIANDNIELEVPTNTKEKGGSA